MILILFFWNEAAVEAEKERVILILPASTFHFPCPPQEPLGKSWRKCVLVISFDTPPVGHGMNRAIFH